MQTRFFFSLRGRTAAATTKVTKSTLLTNPFDSIFTLIDTRANIADPRDAEGKKVRTYVYDTDPFLNAIDHALSPHIIVEMPTISEEPSSTNGKVKHVFWKQRIAIRTARLGASNGDVDAGRRDMKNIVDDLFETLNSMTHRATLSADSLYKVNLRQLSMISTSYDDKDYYESEFELTYYTRLVTSS